LRFAETRRVPQDVVELQHYLAHPQPGEPVRATLGAGSRVPLWILGSSLFGAQLAAMLGLRPESSGSLTGFSRASRTISARRSSSVAGLPGGR